MDGCQGSVAPSGAISLEVTRNYGDLRVRKVSWLWKLKNFFQTRIREIPQEVVYRFLGKAFGLVVVRSELRGRVIHADGTVTDYGVLSRRVVTDAFVAAVASALNASGFANFGNFKYHGFGTGTTAEDASQTALVTELTTEYAVDSTRPTGSQGASAGAYTTVGTLSPDSGGTLAITEHGVFSANAAGTLMDRSKFAAVNLVAGVDSLQVTYTITFSSGG